MVHLQTMWHEFSAQQGNVPGAQQGEVVVTLMQPVGGVGEVTLPSNDVSIAAEAGNMIGVQLLLDDGRRLFVGAANLAGIVDAPLSKGVRAHRREGEPGTGGPRPEVAPGQLGQDRPDVQRGEEERIADEQDREQRAEQEHEEDQPDEAHRARSGRPRAEQGKAEGTADKAPAAAQRRAGK
jgi:hypothetical protein